MSRYVLSVLTVISGLVVSSCKIQRPAESGDSESASMHGLGLDHTVGSGLDSAAISALLRKAQATHSSALLVLDEGKTVAEWYAEGAGPVQTMSVTKSIVSLAVGELLEEGKLKSLDEPVFHFYPEWHSGKKARVTIRQLLNHTSGLRAARTTEGIYASRDFIAYAIQSEVVSEPGSRFFYNNNAANLLAGVVLKASGEPLDMFVKRHLFTPLGITDYVWEHDEAGNPQGMAGLHLGAADLAKIGELFMDRGTYRGQRIIDPSWLEQSIRPSQRFRSDAGLLWWLLNGSGVEAQARPVERWTLAPLHRQQTPRHFLGFYAAGYLGQYLVVIPEARIVAVRLITANRHQTESDDYASFPAEVISLAFQAQAR